MFGIKRYALRLALTAALSGLAAGGMVGGLIGGRPGVASAQEDGTGPGLAEQTTPEPKQIAQGAAPEDCPRPCNVLSALEPHRPNRVLIWSYHRAGNEEDERLRQEVTFQISLKKRTLDFHLGCGLGCLWVFNAPLYVAYTQNSFWQFYDDDNSSPFRETVYNPELFLDYEDTWFKDHPMGLRVGLEHLSNGQALPRSRSWNRLYVEPSVSYDRTFTAAKIWYRLPEGEPSTQEEPQGDDNPEILDYYGHMELRGRLSISDNQVFSIMLRHGKKPGTLTAQMDYQHQRLDFQPGVFLHFSYFNGYGESLIDYDRRVKRFGLGFSFN